MNKTFYFHQNVQTPNGPGVVQGVSAEGKVMVSHRPQDVPAELRPVKKVLWVLKWYPVENVKSE